MVLHWGDFCPLFRPDESHRRNEELLPGRDRGEKSTWRLHARWPVPSSDLPLDHVCLLLSVLVFCQYAHVPVCPGVKHHGRQQLRVSGRISTGGWFQCWSRYLQRQPFSTQACGRTSTLRIRVSNLGGLLEASKQRGEQAAIKMHSCGGTMQSTTTSNCCHVFGTFTLWSTSDLMPSVRVKNRLNQGRSTCVLTKDMNCLKNTTQLNPR